MEDFVTYEIAVKLKEKGFDKLCLLCYTNKQKLVQNSVQSTICDAICVNDILNSYNRLNNGYTDVPAIGQVLKWLREEKKMHIIIPASFYEGYWWEVRDFNRELSEYSDIEYDTYEKAAIACIEYVLDNLI